MAAAVSESTVRIRRWRKRDIPGLVECHRAAYPDYPAKDHYGSRLHESQLAAFPEGQVLAEIDGRVVGYATALILQIDDESHRYTYNELTGSGTFMTHNPSGDSLYGSDIAVHPDFRGRGIAGKLYRRRKALVRRFNLRRMIAYGRIPGYAEQGRGMTPEAYVERVKAGELSDSALRAHLKAGYRVKRILLDFQKDASSLNYATLLEWNNPKYQTEKRLIASPPLQRPVRKVRIGAAQFLMRRIEDRREFEQTVEFFADAANAYHCHFLVLPELFTTQLLYTIPGERDTANPMELIADYHEDYLKLLGGLASRHQLYIIGGSTPVRRSDGLYNVAHLFTPSGNVYTQDKLHITPTERDEWKILPGDGLKLFDTPLGRIAIQVCYDIEFPEASRLLALAGAELVFVPFSTDERKGYNRVRYTARARAVENYMYVVLAGNAGNLPSIRNYLINYAQSAVFTPSDFAFPLNALAGQADPNVENIVVAEVDLTSLEQQREIGSVRPFFERRADLYEIRANREIEVVNVE